MKKIISITMIGVLCVSLFSCGKAEEGGQALDAAKNGANNMEQGYAMEAVDMGAAKLIALLEQ